jgi:hypothetical protein
MTTRSFKKTVNSATLGFEEKLWAAADKLRSHMDLPGISTRSKDGLTLKDISDALNKHRLVKKS